MNFISSLKSKIYVVQNTSFTGIKNNNNFVVFESKVEVISLSGWWQACHTLCLVLLCSNSSHEVYRLFFFFQREEEEEHYRLPGGIYTTAEPRPNAYIPDDDSELPIPRPYGSLAPFKPTEPGSTMRHIRKPVIKPIEI